MTAFVIQAEKLSRHFGDLKAVQELDLQVEKGIIYGFLGPNGCGKTTAMRMLIGLLKPTSGKIEVLGARLPDNVAGLRSRIGYMTQKFSLYDDLTVMENLTFVADIFSITAKARRQRVDELISTYDLGGSRHQLAGSMSGGQRQRLALAAATLHKPDLLFLDEPTSAVDPENRRDFWEKLFDLSDSGTTILVSTHYMDEAERCHRLAILEDGIKRRDGSPQQLMQDMGAKVVELSAADLREIKKSLASLPEVISAAQLGSHLRVLVKGAVSDPVEYLSQQQCIGPDVSLELVRPSLEDVFVTSTGGGRQ